MLMNFCTGLKGVKPLNHIAETHLHSTVRICLYRAFLLAAPLHSAVIFAVRVAYRNLVQFQSASVLSLRLLTVFQGTRSVRLYTQAAPNTCQGMVCKMLCRCSIKDCCYHNDPHLWAIFCAQAQVLYMASCLPMHLQCWPAADV